MIATEELDEISLLERAANMKPGSSPNLYQQRRLDLNEVPDATESFLFPEGQHPFKVVGVDEKVGKAKTDEMGYEKPGTPYVEIQLECTDGVAKGYKLFDRLMLTGKGMSRLKLFLKATGLLNADGSFTGCWGDFLGKEVWCDVETERRDYNGKPTERSKVAFVGYHPKDAFAFEAEQPETLTQATPPSRNGGGTPPWKQ